MAEKKLPDGVLVHTRPDPEQMKQRSLKGIRSLKERRQMRDLLRDRLDAPIDGSDKTGADMAMDALAGKMITGEIPALRLGLEMLGELKPANNIHVDEMKNLTVLVSSSEAGQNLQRILANEKAAANGNDNTDEQVL